MGLAPTDAEGAAPARRRWRRWWPAALAGAIVLIAVAYLSLRAPPAICIAVATSLSGESAASGQEEAAGAQAYVDEVNRAGGIHGRHVELLLFDDQSGARGAADNVAAIADSGCLAVLGHRLSLASVAAGPGYRAARIPALTGTSHSDGLTVGNPWYFRAQNTASLLGRSVADYLRTVLDAPFVHLVMADTPGDRKFVEGFASGYDSARQRAWTFSSVPEHRQSSAEAMAKALAAAPQRGIIVITTGENNVPAAVMALRRRGLDGTIVAGTGTAHEEFLHRFDGQPEERRQPGFFSRNLYAVAPMIYDSMSAQLQSAASPYLLETGRTPGWIFGNSYYAAWVLVEALRRAELRHRPDTVAADRDRVRAALAGMNSPRTGVQTPGQTLYFDSGRNMPWPIRLGFFHEDRFVSAPEQLVRIDHPEQVNLAEELGRGHIVAIGDQYYWRQRVVYTGIDINRLNRIDLRDGSFNVDINLWMRYAGTDDSPTRVEFPALLDRAAFRPDTPEEASLEEGLNYRLFRINGNFKANYDLHEYPFDEQELVIRFLNRQRSREQVTYVVDRFGLALSNGNSNVPSDLSPFSGLQQWRLVNIRYFVEALSRSSTLGKPSLHGSRVQTEFAGFNAAIVLKRNYGIYVIKSLIPLVLLLLVVFTTLFLPENLFRERITIPVTAILTSAVLLLSVNTQIGDIGYTVAIEYIFYTFFALCLFTMMVGISHDALSLNGRPKEALLLAHAGQLVYVLTVAGMVIFFWWRYGTD